MEFVWMFVTIMAIAVILVLLMQTARGAVWTALTLLQFGMAVAVVCLAALHYGWVK